MRFLLALSVALVGCGSPHAAPGATTTSMDAGITEDVETLPYDGGKVQWDGWAGVFVETYCVQCHSPTAYCVECHPNGDPRTPNYELKAPVVANAEVIRCGVAAHQNPAWGCNGVVPEQYPLPQDDPPHPYPSDVDRARIVGWFDAGCP